MKIVFVCDTMGSGGAERVISVLANEFTEQGHSISIIMLSKIADKPFYTLNSRISLIYLAKNFVGKPSIFKKTTLLKKTIIELSPDIVIAFLSYVCIYTWRALRKTKIPYIVSERNDPNQRSFVKQFLLNQSFKKATGCVFQTEDALRWYKNVAKVKAEVIYNPVGLDCNHLKHSSRKKQILYVGRFTDQKNCLMLIDSFELFSEKHPDYILKMYGNGVLEGDIKRKIISDNIKDKVVVVPSSKTWQADEFDSAMFVLPSKYEGMPNVLAEALCLGIPSVSTNCTIGGPKELKKIFCNQLILSESIDSKSFANAMEQCVAINDKILLKPNVPTQLQIDTIAHKWIEFIGTILMNQEK